MQYFVHITNKAETGKLQTMVCLQNVTTSYQKNPTKSNNILIYNRFLTNLSSHVGKLMN